LRPYASHTCSVAAELCGLPFIDEKTPRSG
jgi:hypothetical protein